MTYLTIEGQGGPEGVEFEKAISLLYKLTYTLRMSYKKELFPEYQPYVVGSLEGIWSTIDNKPYQFGDDKKSLSFKLMIVQPVWFTKVMYNYLIEIIKKDIPEITNVKYEVIEEGECIQILHLGSYDTEAETLKSVFCELKENNYDYKPESHHEIYLSDPRKTSPEKLKTILRYQIIMKEDQ